MSAKSTIEKGKEMLSDTAITAAIKAKLLKESFAEAKNVHVETTKGVVTLTGKLSTAKEVKQAVETAKSTDGVKEVESKLQVHSS